PENVGVVLDYPGQPWKKERRRLALDRLNTRPFIKLLKQYKPDITICTHFLPAEIISWLKAKERIERPPAIVVTDLDVHAMWLCHNYSRYFVPIEETRVHLQNLCIPSVKIAVTGIPIAPMFAERKDKAEMRRKPGLKPDRTTISVSAGGFGAGPIEHVLTSLMDLRHEAQVVAIAGGN